MKKFNFLTPRKAPTEIASEDTSKIRIRALAKDRYAGLQGIDYINARKIETSTQAPNQPPKAKDRRTWRSKITENSGAIDAS